MNDLELIKQQAKKELEEENFKAAVEQEKERLRNKTSIWNFLPYRIKIERRV